MSQPLDAISNRPLEGGASFSLGNRLARVAWGIGWLALARFTPPPLHGWRRLILKAFGARIAKGARVHASVRIWLPANLEMGENCLIGPGVRLYNQGQITIGAPATGTVEVGAGVAIGPAVLGAYRLEDGPTFVTNNAAYIRRLNAGHSAQAPAGFVEAVVAREASR